LMGVAAEQYPHRRFNPLSREWVLVSPQRLQRPWLGLEERPPLEQLPTYDPSCSLCPGNTRANHKGNPAYSDTFVFTNDYPSLALTNPSQPADASPLLRTENARGICKVICFTPRHDLSLGLIDLDGVIRVIDVFTGLYDELGRRREIQHVQIFENRGAMMGASNPHPHGQIWATDYIPHYVMIEQETQLAYHLIHKRTLLSDYVSLELDLGERFVCSNDHFVALAPHWAVWPYDTLVVSRRPLGRLTDLSVQERAGLADILRRVSIRYDNLYEVPFPYSMGLHQAPTDGVEHAEWHFHIHFYPPLLRSASIRKHMVGFELLAEPQRDITPESAAQTLRSQPEVHHRQATPPVG
jgi:UDPglucose--hexose-1-phosphate uridylyltransferase